MSSPSTVKQSGSVTPGHVAVWASTGVIEDGGPTQPPPPSSNVVEQSGNVTPTHIVKWAATGVVEDGGSGGTWRGNYAANTQYFYLDFVLDPATSNVYSVLQNYVSVSIAADVAAGNLALALTPVAIQPIVNHQTGTSYTLLNTDNNKIISLNNASPVTVTLPNSFSVGYNCILIQEGAGQVLVSPASGATLHSANGFLHTNVRYSEVYLFVTTNGSGTNASWRMGGDMAT